MEKAPKPNKFLSRIHTRSLWWIAFGMLAVVLSDVFPVFLADRWYYQGIFEWIRVVYDLVLGWLPFPMIYIVFGVILIRLILWYRERKKGILFLVSKALGGIAFMILMFYLVWGFNYRQIPLQTRLGYDLKSVTPKEIEVEFHRATEELERAVLSLPAQLTSDQSIKNFHVTDDDLREDVEKALRQLGLPVHGKVRVRQLWPPGFLLRWSTAGIYIPHAFEGHIDKGLLSVQKPFTMAHEMAHGYGVTDEGACNFIAWLACRQSENPWTKFGGTFTYWRYAASEMPVDSIEKEKPFISPIVLRSLALIRENDKKYPDLLPKIRDAVYSNYLKHHGVEGGLRSYDYVVLMVVEYLGKERK